MIHISRDRLVLSVDIGELLADSRRKFEAEFVVSRKQKSLRNVRVDTKSFQLLKPQLLELFFGKCAFCESHLLRPIEADIVWYRPRAGAVGLKAKKTDPDHYWWLAHEWANLYIACRICARNKANRFPVIGRRAKIGATGAELAKEHRLLLDPCADEPAHELLFLASGVVEGLTRRAKTTIDVFQLNRGALIDNRKATAQHVGDLLEATQLLERTPEGARTKSERKLLKDGRDSIERSCREESAYAALNRGLVRGLPLKRVGRKSEKIIRTSTSTTASVDTQYRIADTQSSTWIRSIEIQNFRALANVRLDFPNASTESGVEPWLVMLGENGLGKSSVLKAVALPYLVNAGIADQFVDAKECLRRQSNSGRGHIKLSFGNDRAATLRFGKKHNGFELEGDLPDIPILGYGSTRLPPPAGDQSLSSLRRVRLDNLFDPRAPLSDAEPWLSDPKRVPKATFDKLATALLTLMSADKSTRIERRSGKLYVRIGGGRVPLRDMSDGYQSVLALATDIIVNLAADWDSMSSAQGTVLLDEIEVHLHPKWRLEIVSALRSVFPRVRFIVSTHDPLCLNNLQPGELHRLYFDQETTHVACVQMDVPRGLRADQLLTGAWFGLATTLDPDTQRLFREYTETLNSRETSLNRARLRALRKELKQRTGGFGETAIERVALGVAAELMDEQGDSQKWDPAAARESIRDRMKKMKITS